jgi:sugar phosphate isomerase/epimerase
LQFVKAVKSVPELANSADNPGMHTVDRRTFLLAAVGVSAAPALIRARRAPRYPIAFSTLGCPSWSWRTVLDQASRLGYAAIELRGIAGEMDLTKVPELTGTRQAAAMKDLAALGIEISDLGASAAMHETGIARDKALDEARRFVDLAHALRVPYVRLFGDAIPKGEDRATAIARVVDGFREMARYAAPAHVTILMESHGDFTHSTDIRAVHDGVGSDAFAILWDAHHTFAAGHEAPADTWAALGPWVRHTHLKDSRPDGNDRRYVLTGAGDVPVKAQVDVLVKGGYKGYYCFEWEKKWHPEIEPPEVAFPHYAKTMTAYLEAAGVKAQ